MIHRPRVISTDEPSAQPDRHTGLQVIALLRSYRQRASLIAVANNPEILAGADVVIVLRDGQVTDVSDRVTHKTEEAMA